MRFEMVRFFFLSFAMVWMFGCSFNPPITPPTVRTPQEVEAARVSRRENNVFAADSRFLVGDMKSSGDAYAMAARDSDHGLSNMAKRRLASVYEVQGKEKEALKLLVELERKHDSPIALDPMTMLKILYFAERQKDEGTRKMVIEDAKIAQKRAFDIIHDPLMAPGTSNSLYYWLAMEAANATDWVLFHWSTDHAKSSGPLSDQQQIQIASVVSQTNPGEARRIFSALGAKLEGEDKLRVDATIQRIKDKEGEDKDQSNRKPDMIMNIETIPSVIKYRATGYWLTGKVPKFKIFAMRMGTAG